MKTLRQLLDDKKQTLVVISPLDSVHRALELLAHYDIGALLVMDGEKLVGIFSERDYARKIILQGRSSKQTLVQEIMTTNLVTVLPRNTVDECMAIMTEKRVRHLPVLDEDQNVLGLVSIGDAVKETISDQKFIINQLEHYILT